MTKEDLLRCILQVTVGLAGVIPHIGIPVEKYTFLTNTLIFLDFVAMLCFAHR